MEKFGEIAVREGLLTKFQIDMILKEQADSYMYFGEALASIGVITNEEVMSQLKQYNREVRLQHYGNETGSTEQVLSGV